MLYFYGLSLGLHTLLSGRVSREALKNLIIPVNYWRNLEFALALKELSPIPSDRILDLGSPKLLSIYIADRIGSEIYLTDIEEYFVEDYRRFQRTRGVPDDRFKPMVVDGRTLPFDDNSFTKIYSVSVLEHIPDEGDSLCIKELGRTLAPGGKCVLTVPFASVSRLEYKSAASFYWSGKSSDRATDGSVFFQRRYSESDLFERLINPSGLHLASLQYFGERIRLGGGKEIASYLHPLMGPLHPLLSYAFHVGPSDTWQSLPSPLGALIVLQKTLS